MSGLPTLPAPLFRRIVCAIGAIVALEIAIVGFVVASYGVRTRDFGWTAVRANGRTVIRQVDPSGPASGLIERGDVVVAINGDRRLDRLHVNEIRRFLPAGAHYTLTISRPGDERVVPLVVTAGTSLEQWRLSISLVVSAVVWCFVATLIGLLRPEQPIARSAYVAGMALGLFLLNQARFPSMPWLLRAPQNALAFVFPFSPLHLAVGYDFYARFPDGRLPSRLWRAIDIAIFATCAVLCVTGPLLAPVAVFAGPGALLALRYRLAVLDPWLAYVGMLIFPLTGVAILAVVAHKYRLVGNTSERRRLRWVVWGTVIGLMPFLIIQVINVSARLSGSPMSFGSWIAAANLVTTAIPVSFAYAIIKHRVFDITLVVRRGLQYLLAKNALRGLLLLPLAALAYGMVAHRNEPIGRLLLTNSPYLYLVVAAVLCLKFHPQMRRWIDRRFFREAYDRERLLVALIDDLDTLDSASAVSKLVSRELKAAFHPSCLFIWYDEANRARLTLSYSSGGDIHRAELEPSSGLLQLAAGASSIIELPLARPEELPEADRQWLSDTGVRLVAPMIGTDRNVVGLLMLGDKKSEEPYSADDLRLLQAVARQIAVGHENLRLKDQVHQDRRIRHDVLAHLEATHISLLKECPSCGACYDAAASACSADGTELRLSLPVERTIGGKYRLDRLIGRGGMGAVYEAADLRLGRRVAVKIMLGRAFGDQRALRRFEREAQASARLAHPNIVTIFDYGGVGAEGAFLVMELVRGRTLRAELNRTGRVPPAILADWFEQICAAIATAHQEGIVHRDLKPENVLITTDATGADRVKVLDFGLAKISAAEDDAGVLTETGVVVGTAPYMAPEQLTAGHIDHRTDIFALGVIAVEAMTGLRPFRGRAQVELLAAIVTERWTLGGTDPAWRHIESILQRALAIDPGARHQSVGDLARDVVPAMRSLVERAPSSWITGDEETRAG
jgi:hypothetical protein